MHGKTTFPELTAQDKAFLAANPWIAALYNDRETSIPCTPGHRLSAPTWVQRDRLFSSTLRDSGAVATTLAWHAPFDFRSVENAVAKDEAEAHRGEVETGEARDDGHMYLIPSMTLAFDLGEGVRGFQGVTHGGMFAVLVDEGVGNFLAENQAATLRAEAGGFRGMAGAGEDGGKRLASRLGGRGNTTAFTVGMAVKFLKPVVVPGAVIVKSWLGGIVGRKIVVKSVIEGQGGVRYGECESTWIVVPAAKAKL